MATFLNLLKSIKRRPVFARISASYTPFIQAVMRLKILSMAEETENRQILKVSALESFSVALILHYTLFTTINLFEKTH